MVVSAVLVVVLLTVGKVLALLDFEFVQIQVLNQVRIRVIILIIFDFLNQRRLGINKYFLFFWGVYSWLYFAMLIEAAPPFAVHLSSSYFRFSFLIYILEIH